MIKYIEKHFSKAFLQFIGFGIIGAFNTVLSYGITNGCYYLLGLHEQISNVITFVITVFISFLLNRTFVFKKTESANVEITNDNDEITNDNGEIANANADSNPWYMELIKVYISYAFTELFLMALFLFVEERLLGIPHYIATLLNLIVTVPINFILNKFWAYKNHD